MNAYLICTTHGLTLLKYVAEKSRKEWEELFGEGENKFWQSTAQYIVLSSGLVGNDRFPFSLSWLGFRCSVMPVQHGEFGIFHVYMQLEHSHASNTHTELTYSPFLVCKSLNTILTNTSGGDLKTFLSEASHLINQRVNDSSFNNSVGDDEQAWWREFLQGQNMSKHLQSLEDNSMKKFLSFDQHEHVSKVLSPLTQHMNRTVFDKFQLDKLTDKIFLTGYYLTLNNDIADMERLFTSRLHHVHDSHFVHMEDDSLIRRYVETAAKCGTGVCMLLCDVSSAVIALRITEDIVVLCVFAYPTSSMKNEGKNDVGNFPDPLLRSLLSNEEAVALVLQHDYSKEDYVNVTLQYPADRLLQAGLLEELQGAVAAGNNIFA